VTSTPATARDASLADVADLVRIRLVMLEAMATVSDLSWIAAAEQELTDQLREGSMIGAVSEVEGRVVSGGLARVWRQLPGPDGDDGSRGWVFSVATEPEHRSRGHARAVVAHLLRRLDAAGVHRVDLTASDDGVAMYRSMGFAAPAVPLLRRIRPRDGR
jgi:ribosomal protein S18 acetylase RimI-like enzyme